MMKLLMGPHGEIREFLIDYVENQLPVAKKFQFWIHLVLCEDCNSYLRRYNSSVKISRNFLEDPPPGTIGKFDHDVSGRTDYGKQKKN